MNKDGDARVQGKFLWMGLWLINVVFLVGTFYSSTNPVLRLFDLKRETCLAAWWSGAQLLCFGLLAMTAANRFAPTDKGMGRRLFWLGLVAGLGLCADELGSIHERASSLAPENKDFVLLPFAAIGGAIVAWNLWALFVRRKSLGSAWAWIACGFGMFGLVWAQEIVEHKFEWTGVMRGIRGVAEEGSELCGFFLLLVGMIFLLRAQQGRHLTALDVLPDRKLARSLSILLLACSVPVIALRAQFTDEQLALPRRGDFGMVIPIMLFFLMALITFRSGIEEKIRCLRWWFLAAVMVLLSVDAEVHLHRVVAIYFPIPGTTDPLRTDVNLLWTVPLLGLALAVPARNPLRILCAAASLWALALFSLWFSNVWLTVTMPYLASALACIAILWWMPSGARLNPKPERSPISTLHPPRVA